MYINLSLIDLDANKSWYELGKEVGLEVVSDEEVEEEEEEADEEVVHVCTMKGTKCREN